MNLPLFFANLKASRTSLISWGGCLILYGLLVVNLYPSIKKASGYQAIFEAMPEQWKVAMGTQGLQGLFDPQGILDFGVWLGIEYINWWPVLFSIYAIFVAGGIVAKEVEQGTMDLLLSQPIRRHQVVISKLATFLVNLFVLALASLGGIFLGLLITGINANINGILLAFLQGFLLVLAVGSYSALASCIFLDPRRALLAAGVLTATFYILNLLASSVKALEWTQRLSLFYYFKAPEIIQHTALNWTGLSLYVALALLCFLASLLVFERRDLTP